MQPIQFTKGEEKVAPSCRRLNNGLLLSTSTLLYLDQSDPYVRLIVTAKHLAQQCAERPTKLRTQSFVTLKLGK